MFGPFIKFHVESGGSSLPQQPARNAFEVLREGQKKLPSRIEVPKNKKQKLRNAIIDMLDHNGLLPSRETVLLDGICIFCSCDDGITIPDKCYPICGSCAATKQPIAKTI